MTPLRRAALASAAGLASALAFPSPGWWPLAFVGWAPLLIAVSGMRARGAAVLGGVAGLVFNLVLLRWLQPLSTVGWVALAFYLSLYIAVFAAVVATLGRRPRWWTIAAIAGAWIALEWVRSWALTGFGWGALGYALIPAPRLVQLASIGGVFAVSGCAIAVNAAVAASWPALRRRESRAAAPHLVLALGVPLAMGLHGSLALSSADPDWTTLRVAVIQGDISPHEKWGDRGVYTAFSRYVGESDRAMAANPALIVWPETAIPIALDPDDRLELRARALRRRVQEQWRVPLLFGVPARSGEAERFYNTATLYRPEGAAASPYYKRRLVPFGEYTPLPSLFGSLPRVVAGPEFVPGPAAPPFALGSARVGVLICFEDVFGDEAAARARHANLLVVITNDAWFGPSGVEQHRDITVMRAVETRRSIARAANTGITELIDPFGRGLTRAPAGTSHAVAALPLVDRRTLYMRAPAALPLFSLGGALLGLAAVLIGARRPAPGTSARTSARQTRPAPRRSRGPSRRGCSARAPHHPPSPAPRRAAPRRR